MKKWIMVSGCYGLMFGAAQAGQWSAESCRHLQEMKASTYARNIVGARERFWSVAAILLAQQDGCGVDIRAELNAAKAAALAEAPRLPHRNMYNLTS